MKTFRVELTAFMDVAAENEEDAEDKALQELRKTIYDIEFHHNVEELETDK